MARALYVLDLLQSLLLHDNFGRDDYRELCELIIKFLGGQVISSMPFFYLYPIVNNNSLTVCIVAHYYTAISIIQVIRPNRPIIPGQDHFQMRAPGALHHARFMASCLYIMKITMMADSLPPGLVTPAMMRKMQRMALFIALIHGPWFLQARLSIPAPRLDLELWHHIHSYEVS